MPEPTSVGNVSVHGAGDQRNMSKEEKEALKPERFEEGKENAHLANDSKDQRSIANRLAREEMKNNAEEEESPEVEMLKKDPTLLARSHGNEPSKGAKIDAEILAEEEEELRRKGKLN